MSSDIVTDAARLAALNGYAILDTPPEVAFEDIVQITQTVCDTPVALVSLVTGDRQWFKARSGFEPCETDLSRSVCKFVLTEPDVLVIDDLALDERTRSNPLVTGSPHIRFYAGAPLRTDDGEVLGSLCAIDDKPRPGGLTPRQATTLKALARQVMAHLDLRRTVLERDELFAEHGRAAGRRDALLHLGDRLRDLETIAEMTQAASAIVGQTVGAVRAGFGRLEDDGECVVVEPDWTADGSSSIAGRHRFADYGELTNELLRGEALVISDVETDPRTASDPEPLLALGIRSLVNMPVRERGRTVAVLLVHDSKPRPWRKEVLTFLRNVADRLEVGVARLRAEANQRVLNQELSHRMKNTFAMVSAIAGQTLREVTERDAIDAFTQRLKALSSAHDVLLQGNWASAKLADVACTVIGATQDLRRVHITGPTLQMGPRATLSTSLLLHELVTNAVKHGALSTDAGTVHINWQVDRATNEVALHWRERSGPKVKAPPRKGFGSRLIRLGLVGAGGSTLTFAEDGFQGEFRAALDEMQAV